MARKAKQPTIEQAMLIKKNGLDSDSGEWLVLWESDTKMFLINRITGKARKIDK